MEKIFEQMDKENIIINEMKLWTLFNLFKFSHC